MDQDESGQITMDEYFTYVKDWKTPGGQTPHGYIAQTAFRFIDLDGSGVLTKSEFLATAQLNSRTFLLELRKLCDQIAMKYETFEGAFNELESTGDKDGRLTFKEFTRAWKQELEM